MHSVAPLKIQLDPLNPGQFFACCGLFELLSFDDVGLLAYFEIDFTLPRVAQFCLLRSEGTRALDAVLGELRGAKVQFSEEGGESATRPATIPYRENRIDLDWWLDEFRAGTANLKCWAGQVTTRNLFQELLPLLDPSSTGEDLFERSQLTKAKFGVDPRSAWNALDFGFSPNQHGSDSATFPAVEILAAFGLQYFRPDARKREAVRYSLWREPLPASIARLAFRAPWAGLPVLNLTFDIRKRGQSYKFFTFAVSAEKERTFR